MLTISIVAWVVVVIYLCIISSTLGEVKRTMSELSTAVAAIAEDVIELQAASKAVLDLLQQPNPDVSAAIAALQNADAAFDAVRDGLNAAVPKSEPPTEV